MVKYLDVKGRHPLVKDLEGDLNVESDCEGDLLEVRDETSEVGEEQTRAVLITGSFSAYAHNLVPSPVSREITGPQLEVSILLSLHRRDLVRSPEVPRYRFSLEPHPRKYGGGGTTSLLAEEHLRSGELGEAAFNRMSRAGH